MIKYIKHSGLIEPSNGVTKRGFAIRRTAKLKINLSPDYHPKILDFVLFRSTEQWPCSKIKIEVNHEIRQKFHLKNLGITKKRIDLSNCKMGSHVSIHFDIYPKGLFKILNKLRYSFTKKNPNLLVRDSILLQSLYIDYFKIFSYDEEPRFNDCLLNRMEKSPIRVLGFFNQTFGLAEASRRTFQAIQSTNINPIATQIPYSGNHRGKEGSVIADKKVPTDKNEIRIFHFNGDHLQRLVEDWGPEVLNCRYKIGFWHWELPNFPDDYSYWFNMVDEVWVPSRFVFDAIAPKSPKPVQIIPLALDDKILNPPPPGREKFKIPKEKLIFLITFDFYSIMERKNPIDGIRAFSKLINEEEYEDKIHLIVKVSNQHADPDGYENLLKEIGAIESDKVTLISEVLSKNDMLQLINSSDSLISLHRSEGYGLHLAEAIAMGKAVVATNWSGNTEFMNNKNSYPVDYELIELKQDYGPYRKGNYWANPCLKDAHDKIKEVVHHFLENGKFSNSKSSNYYNQIINNEKIGSKIDFRIKCIESSRHVK